jgi:methyl-CpG-binding domain protein 4
VGQEPALKIYGVGEFGIDSFNVFCRGDLKTAPGDKTLQSFVSWQKRHAGVKEEGSD